MEGIFSLVKRNDAFSKDNHICTETAIGSLGKLGLFQN